MSLTAEAGRDRCRFCLGECRRGRASTNTRGAPQNYALRNLPAGFLRALLDLRFVALRSRSRPYQRELTMVYDHGMLSLKELYGRNCHLEVQSYLPCRLGES